MPTSLTISVSDVLASLEAMDPNAPINAVTEGWGKDAQTLLAIEIYNVTQRTIDRTSGPYSTGALASSVTGQAYENAKNGTLIAVWFNNAQQYAAWNRYYAPYQEGEPLGLHTYTNGMHHMLYDSQTEDADQIRTWAVSTGQAAEDALFGGL